MTMTPEVAKRRSWIAWSWPERLIVAGAWIVPIVLVVQRGGGWLTGASLLMAFALLQWIVWRHGGWGLLGPHYYYGVVRLARRGQSARLRIVYLVALFAALVYVFETSPVTHIGSRNDFARVSERFSYVLFVVQNIAIMVLTPAYLASAIAEEKERRTLDLLFTTRLSNTEIVLGVLFSRTIHLMGFVLAGFPILCAIQFWGGIDMAMLAGNLANTLLNIITIGSISLFVSTLTSSVAAAVTCSYVVVLPAWTCCTGMLHGGPLVLQDARSGVTNALTIQQIGYLAIGHAIVTISFLCMAVVSVRGGDPLGPFAIPMHHAPHLMVRVVPDTASATVEIMAMAPANVPQAIDAIAAGAPPVPRFPDTPQPIRAQERQDFFGVPYELPPVSENALLWKECHLGGPASAFSPVLLAPLIPLACGMGVLIAGYSVAALVRGSGKEWLPFLKVFYYLFLGCYGLGVGFRASASIARERQQRTLEPLLLLPVDRREILVVKWLGSYWRAWPWAAFAFGDVVLGLAIGAYHPFSAVLLCLAPLPILSFVASVGLLLSITASTVLRANLMMGTILVALLVTLPSMEPLAFSWSPRQDAWQRVNIIGTAGVLLFFLIVAWGCWRCALFLFDRTRRPD